MESDIADRVLRKDLENIIKKVSQGKTLTDSERNRIKKELGDSSDSVQGDTGYVKNLTELATRFGVDRKTINRWRKMKGAPKPYSNGMHSIPKWIEFIDKNSLKGSASNDPCSEDLKLRELIADVRKKEILLGALEERYVPIEKISEVWTTHIGQIRQILESRFLNELPPILTTLDAVQIREKMQEVLDECYKLLSVAADSIKEPVDIED